MIPEPHRMPPEVFASLAAGGGGPESARLLLAVQRSKHLLLIRTLTDLATVKGHPRAPMVRSAYRSLARVQKLAPEAAATVLFYPAVGAWAMRTVLLLRQGIAAARPERLAAVAAAAAVRGGVPDTFDVPLTEGAVSLPSLGVARLPGSASRASLRSRAGRAEIVAGTHGVAIPADPHTDAPGWCGVRRLSAETDGSRIDLFLDDLDPYRFPSPAARRRRLSKRSVVRWRIALAEGWRLLVRHHGTTAAEVAAVITTLTPLADRPGRHCSATAREAFGCAALSAPTSGRSAAVTLAHELQHAKLAALMDMFELTRAPHGRRFYAPWRTDPRPVAALLHGAYAHMGVAGFWSRQRHVESDAGAALHAHCELARWREAARDAALFLLEGGLLTETGDRFVGGMLAALADLNELDVPARALDRARHHLTEHRARWDGVERNGVGGVGD